MRKLMIFAFILVFAGCMNKKEVVEEKATYQPVAEIESRQPVGLYYDNGTIVWYEVRPRTHFLHIVDAQTGETLGSMARLGQGPEEFMNAVAGWAINDRCLHVFDINDTTRNAYLDLDSFLLKKDYYIPAEKIDKNKVFSVRKMNNSEKAFKANYRGKESEFGTYPIPDIPLLHTGGFGYNPNNGALVYYLSDFPYLAMYQNEGGEFNNKWINSEITPYQKNSDNKVVFDYPMRGIKRIAMLKDYIVGIQQTVARHEEKGAAKGLDVSKREQTVFVYNYDGELVRILDYGVPLLLLAGDVNSNTLYMIVADPEFRIVKSSLS